jgi:hypothetical protein
MKKIVRLTESDLHKIVKESVNRIINEAGDGFYHYSQNYRGVDIPLDMNLEIWGPKIDICIDEKGWPIEKVQRAVNKVYEEDM